MKPEPAPAFLWELFQQIRRRGFPLGIDDYDDLRRSVCLGFGIDTRQSLSELCCTLWAKSQDDREVILALLQKVYENNDISEWKIETLKKQETVVTVEQKKVPTIPYLEDKSEEITREIEPSRNEQAVVESRRGLPEITLRGVKDLPQSHFVFVPQYPLNYRQVVQAWRRLRKPIRRGPPIDIDIQATIQRQSDIGIAAGAVLIPRRINAARLLILEDRHGSMNPFHAFAASVCEAIKSTANFEMIKHYYFHDIPVHGTDINVLGDLRNQLFPKLDPILSKIRPLEDGDIYEDPDLYQPVLIPEILDRYGRGTAIIIISDAGAARRNKDILRLLDTVAFLKGLYKYTRQLVWLNPLTVENWAGTLAEQISRHIPMLPLDIYGSYRAVNILRGQPFLLQRPL